MKKVFNNGDFGCVLKVSTSKFLGVNFPPTFTLSRGVPGILPGGMHIYD